MPSCSNAADRAADREIAGSSAFTDLDRAANSSEDPYTVGLSKESWAACSAVACFTRALRIARLTASCLGCLFIRLFVFGGALPTPSKSKLFTAKANAVNPFLSVGLVEAPASNNARTVGNDSEAQAYMRAVRPCRASLASMSAPCLREDETSPALPRFAASQSLMVAACAPIGRPSSSIPILSGRSRKDTEGRHVNARQFASLRQVSTASASWATQRSPYLRLIPEDSRQPAASSRTTAPASMFVLDEELNSKTRVSANWAAPRAAQPSSSQRRLFIILVARARRRAAPLVPGYVWSTIKPLYPCEAARTP